MPIVTLQLLQGYDAAVKERLGNAVTETVRAIVPAAPEAVTVIIQEIPPENYMRGGTSRPPAPALPDPSLVVRAFLEAMEARDLARASVFLGDDFVMTFPGGVRLQRLEELVEWARPRYRFVRKSYERFDAAGGVVYCFGTLTGEWNNGTAFDGIRFIDRFELAGGLIVRQDVWNDMGEVGRK